MPCPAKPRSKESNSDGLTDGWNRGATFVSITHLPEARECLHNLSELQLVEDSGLSSSVKTHHQNSHLFLSPELIEQLRERKTHDGDSER
jgi:hypothetical protein